MTDDTPSKGAKSRSPAEIRAERLAAELRANLKRRKDRARAQTAANDDGAEAAGRSPPDDTPAG